MAIAAAAGAIVVGRPRIDATRRRFAIMLAAALLAATAVTLAINTIHPIIVERYFMFLYAGAACLVSALGIGSRQAAWQRRNRLAIRRREWPREGPLHQIQLIWCT